MSDTKKKRGRPRKEGARRRRVVSSCNDEEYALMERAARINNMSLSEFIRVNIHNASVDTINRREKMLESMYGRGGDEEYYDDFSYEEDRDEEECI